MLRLWWRSTLLLPFLLSLLSVSFSVLVVLRSSMAAGDEEKGKGEEEEARISSSIAARPMTFTVLPETLEVRRTGEEEIWLPLDGRQGECGEEIGRRDWVMRIASSFARVRMRFCLWVVVSLKFGPLGGKE